MIAYLDSSVVLRIILNQNDKSSDVESVKRAIASRLMKTECLRTLDRFRIIGTLNEDEYLTAVEDLYELLKTVEWIEISTLVLDRASTSFPVALGTLDSIHLVSALLWREKMLMEPVFFTHDKMLAKAALSQGLKILH